LQKLEEREKEARALADKLLVANEHLTRSNRAFELLSQQQKKLVALVENSTDFIGMATPEGKGIYINKAGLELVGLKEAQVEGIEILDFFFDEDKPFVRDEIFPIMMEKGSWSGEIRFRHYQTGQSIPMHYNCFSIKDPETGELLGVATISINITERKKQEEELQELTRQLATANEAMKATNDQLTRINIDLDNFIYAASHDLKGPISNIEGLMRILIDSLPADVLSSRGVGDVIGMIKSSIERFKRTIEHLTEVTKLQKENNQDAVMVDLAKVIREVRLDLGPQLKEAGTDLEVDIEACTGISFSEKNLRSVIYNLLSNAMKYRSPARESKVVLQCRPEGEYHVITVRDNGLGMNLAGNQKLFTMFGRLHDHVEGSGVGLYMVKKIVENAGGRIEVESQEGVGSTFRVYIKS
jgi:PAS domain S-box-containing protein